MLLQHRHARSMNVKEKKKIREREDKSRTHLRLVSSNDDLQIKSHHDMTTKDYKSD